MWQQDNAARLIETLKQKNAFIRRDTVTGEYHLHNIFSSCIREEFSHLPEAEQKELWRRAGHWQTLEKEYVAAMDCYFKAGDFELLIRAFEFDRSYTTSGQYKEKMIRYLSGCPMEIRRKHHYAFLVYARLLFMVNEQALFAKICPELYREISEDTAIDDEERSTLLGEFQLMISFSKYNSIEGMGNHFLQADKLMKAPSTILDSVPNWTMGAPSILYMFYREKDSLDREIAMMNWGLAYYHKLTGGHGLGAAEVFEAEICFMRGAFEQSEILLHKALAKAEETKQWSIILCAVFQQARNALLRGDYPGAVHLMKSLYETLKQQNRFTLLYSVDICQAYIDALLGRPDKVPSWIVEGKTDGAKMLFAVIPALQWVQSRAMLEQKKYLMLIGMSEQFFKVAEVFPNLLCRIYLHIHLAAAYRAIFKHDDAAGQLMNALEIAMPDRLYMPFVENSEHIGPLLWDSGLFTAYKDELVIMKKLYEEYHRAVESVKARYFELPVTRLSEREEEVASLAALGLSNREIGSRLFVSENTVKAHLKSTFEKLSIKSRAQLGDYFKQTQ
jgi:LuxR family maltose regulon positive regulatory protein